ncbi:hypothetical protein D3C87_1431570 [compost metagenome]
MQDHLVGAGHLRRGHDLPVDRFLVAVEIAGEAGDVFTDGAGHQAAVLRKIADMAGQGLGVPVGVAGLIDADMAAVRRKGARDHARQGGLACAGRTDHAEDVAGNQPERHRMQQKGRALGVAHADVGQFDIAFRRRQDQGVAH